MLRFDPCVVRPRSFTLLFTLSMPSRAFSSVLEFVVLSACCSLNKTSTRSVCKDNFLPSIIFIYNVSIVTYCYKSADILSKSFSCNIALKFFHNFSALLSVGEDNLANFPSNLFKFTAQFLTSSGRSVAR